MKLIRSYMIRSTVVTALLAAGAISAPALTLSDLVLNPNASVVAGNLRFFNFSNVFQTGDLNVSLDRIFVEPVPGSPGASLSDSGVRFSSPDWTLSGPGLFYDISLDFHVETVSGEALLTDNTLEFAGTVTGNAAAMIGETVLDGVSHTTVANHFVYMDGSLQVLEDHQAFPGGPSTELEISKDFYMFTGRDANAAVTVTHFDQNFSRVPEGGPGLAIIAGAVGAMCWAGGKRRGRRSRDTASV